MFGQTLHGNIYQPGRGQRKGKKNPTMRVEACHLHGANDRVTERQMSTYGRLWRKGASIWGSLLTPDRFC